MTTPQTNKQPQARAVKLRAVVGNRYILQQCPCKDFRRLDSLSFDSQDLREWESLACPFCKRPFQRFKTFEAIMRRYPRLQRIDRVFHYIAPKPIFDAFKKRQIANVSGEVRR